MTIKYVYATGDVSVGIRKVQRGSIWPASDSLVINNPSLFTDNPLNAGLLCQSEPLPEADRVSEADRVERVTAAPGEKRGNVRRD